MKFSRLGAFIVGVVTTAASVVAVSYVDASGGSTIQACADKRTGVMRLISRGSCKRTETLVSWGHRQSLALHYLFAENEAVNCNVPEPVGVASAHLGVDTDEFSP